MSHAEPTSRSEIPAPGRWQPLLYTKADGTPSTAAFLAPHWGRVEAFAVRADQAMPPPPPSWYGDKARAQADEVVELTANLDDTQKAIAEYWADGPKSETPPGHWNLLAQGVSKRDRNSVDKDVKLFYALNTAMCDAGIVTWAAKVKFDYWRPITAIRYFYSGKVVKNWKGEDVAGEAWHPYQPATFPTPPFAEYTSGHSAFSAAAAEVLKQFTASDHFGGEAVWPKGASKVEPGVAPSRDIVLHWNTFSDAADQAGMSRRYGGIHFEAGDIEARKVGRACGKAAFQKAEAQWSGAE